MELCNILAINILEREKENIYKFEREYTKYGSIRCKVVDATINKKRIASSVICFGMNKKAIISYISVVKEHYLSTRQIVLFSIECN